MEKPYLLVVTGRPGSGKTTFAGELGRRLCLPVISRDRIKEGRVRTFGRCQAELPEGANGAATDIFFDTVGGLLQSGVSLIAEAAFQHRIWAPRLTALGGSARVFLLICSVDPRLALERFIRRGLEDPRREYFHGDRGVGMARRGEKPEVGPYEEPRLDAPTFHIDTAGEYRPSVGELERMIFGSPGRP